MLSIACLLSVAGFRSGEEPLLPFTYLTGRRLGGVSWATRTQRAGGFRGIYSRGRMGGCRTRRTLGTLEPEPHREGF